METKMPMTIRTGKPRAAPLAMLARAFVRYWIGVGIVPAGCLAALAQEKDTAVEQWGIYEIVLKGSATGNPFREVELSARFNLGDKTVAVTGFYDEDGIYRIRFMPTQQGSWRYETKSNRPELHGRTGTFEATKPSAGNHGPVRVAHTYHFAYADGTPYRPIG